MTPKIDQELELSTATTATTTTTTTTTDVASHSNSSQVTHRNGIVGHEINNINNINNNISNNNNIKPPHLIITAPQTTKQQQQEIVWSNVGIFVFLHSAALYGLYLCFFGRVKLATWAFTYALFVMGGLGITAGAHRLWAHRSYKARLPLRIALGVFQTLALQNSIYEWVRDHRVHHKHTETDADPHNAKRGFWFSHMGWLVSKKHPLVKEKGAKIPLNDLLADPVVYWQRQYYRPLAILACFVMPTIVPYYLWNESLVNSYFISAILRYVVGLHATWFVNSLAHMYGYKKYDKRINPSENYLVSFMAIGEGFHNYHHTFPMDYATSEYGSAYLNLTKFFIDSMAVLGQVYDRNKIKPEYVKSRRMKTGDLSHIGHNHQEVHDHDY